VWDEPVLDPALAASHPPDGLDYRSWIERGRQRTSARFTWVLTAAAILLAGPFAVLGALTTTGDSAFALLRLTVFGPLAEEMLKVGLPLLVVERRPYWFSSSAQILFAALGGSLAFAAIENLLYLNAYVASPSDLLVAWRWSICVALHVGCSLLAGLGLTRMWRLLWRERRRPAFGVAAPWLVAAVVVHGTYNFGALLLAYSHYSF
jgi:RsiW-degrading membrane proteinase PrsW (M82 family)